MKKPHALNPVEKEKKEKRKEKKRGSKVATESGSGTWYAMLFTEMSLKTELWKLKTQFMCFQFSKLITQKSEN